MVATNGYGVGSRSFTVRSVLVHVRNKSRLASRRRRESERGRELLEAQAGPRGHFTRLIALYQEGTHGRKFSSCAACRLQFLDLRNDILSNSLVKLFHCRGNFILRKVYIPIASMVLC